MHILLTNDDGPPSDAASPYISFFVWAVKNFTNWDLTIVVPSQQRSWIGKAHFAGKDLTAKYAYTNLTNSPTDNSYQGPFPQPQDELRKTAQEWILLDGTPASCADIGVHHLYDKSKGEIDLVISGPNFGRNSTALYIMSSGTVGAAMEGALMNKRAIGLSYAFETKDIDEPILKEASKIAVKLVQQLYSNWSKDADLYTINIPLRPDLKLGTTVIQYAPILENRWTSLYTPKDESRSKTKVTDWEKDIVDATAEDGEKFEWNPDFDYVHKFIEQTTEPTDGKIVSDGKISTIPELVVLSLEESEYVYPAIVSALKKADIPFKSIHSIPSDFKGKVVQFGDYEQLDFDLLMQDNNYKACSYVFRKSLIRKHYLANTIARYLSKNPESVLKKAFPTTFEFELDYAEFLDDSLDDCYELRDEMSANEATLAKTWILKPSMSDKGQGIRLFRTQDELQAIFDSFEEDEDEDEDEEQDHDDNNGVITSQLRHFVIQEYIDLPLLLPQYGNRKFHIRSYVVCNGSIEVFLYNRMLMLFSSDEYIKPEGNDALLMDGHLTNTCLQVGKGDDDLTTNVVEFGQSCLSDDSKSIIIQRLQAILKDLFEAAVNVDKFNFQPLPNAFETFGIDFLVDESLNCHLLEVNSYPDFKQTGDDLKQLIYGLFEGIVDTCVSPFFRDQKIHNANMIPVLDLRTSGSW
ncbi:unnamed protein product [Kuraishia capsulata CBS 1993]|uniref:Survival protein SurE-like phosphatase/nucleotidase domain-containing protein n=1 Tax=Kuraishia capsulata CBS 1993 TaxID=1382522 RepID=W6MSS6_9ASCO|nr:uncharacterized protein KUCA_T00000797001 [Kuraishia capsulata CBS 1993]CDK24830.1 unnamed protein product [Kuraishia capsulata CBS 1993]